MDPERLQKIDAMLDALGKDAAELQRWRAQRWPQLCAECGVPQPHGPRQGESLPPPPPPAGQSSRPASPLPPPPGSKPPLPPTAASTPGASAGSGEGEEFEDLELGEVLELEEDESGSPG